MLLNSSILSFIILIIIYFNASHPDSNCVIVSKKVADNNKVLLMELLKSAE